ncbi:MAG: site-specific integrase [Oscillospiraceae bacterium]|nr:site-specific integrase [Oscillospiraceae bacterium]
MASIRKRGDSYTITVSCGYDIRGKQIRRHKTWRPPAGMTKRQAERELQRQSLIFEEECHYNLTAVDMKFEAFAKIWFEQYAKPNLKVRTVSRYRQMEARVYRSFGHMKMRDITPMVIQRFVYDLGQMGENLATGGGLSPKTIRNYLSFVSGIFSYAAEQGIVRENPCRFVRPPHLPHTERPCYSQQEAQEFLDALHNEPLCWQVYFTLAIFGGFRRGEIMGLEWGDIDLETGVISINRTSLYTKELGVFTDTPKTKNSCRSLKMPRSVMAIIEQFKAEQPTALATDRLFKANDGSPMNPTRVENWLYSFQKRAGLRKLNLHSLRHLNATLLINSGADIKTVSMALGHSQITTTLDIYAHTIAEAQARATAALADILDLKINSN